MVHGQAHKTGGDSVAGRAEQEIIIAFPGQNDRLFARNHDNIPIPLRPQPVLIPAFYLTSNEELEARLPAARLSLSALPQSTLLKLLRSPDGPPNRLARIFKHIKQDRLGVLQGGRLTPKIPVQIYREVHKDNYAWDNDSTMSGAGLFITGDGDPTSIWKVSRVERDVFGAPLITVSPLITAGGFPELDLSTVNDPLIRQEVEGHYREVQKSFQTSAYRALVTNAKNVAEALIPLKAGLAPNKTFNEMLNKISGQQEKQDSVPELSYHLAHKLRILHQRTHLDKVTRVGRGIEPEFAITVIQDLIEILRELGYTKK
jgi:hypothetical protein